MSATLATIYQATLDAIEQVTLYGQSYSIDGRSLTRADLPELRRTLFELKPLIDAEAGRSKETQAKLRRPV